MNWNDNENEIKFVFPMQITILEHIPKALAKQFA